MLVCNQRVLSLLMIPFCMTSTAWEILSHHHAAPSRTTWCDLTPGPTTAMCSSIRKRAAQMYIARRQAQNMDQLSPSAITLNSRAIPVVSSTKHLGVHLCETLRWSGHVDSLIQRTQKQLFILRRLARRPFASSFVSAVYKGMVRPMLEYASVVREPTKNSTLVALERSQLSIARAITRLPRRRHSNEAVLAKIGWPTLAWRRRRYKLLLVWRLVNGEGPPSLSSFFSLPLSSRSHYSLRNPHSLPQVLCHSSHRLKDFLPSAIGL